MLRGTSRRLDGKKTARSRKLRLADRRRCPPLRASLWTGHLSVPPRNAQNWCAPKIPEPCSTSCTSTATTPSVSALSGTATRKPYLDHHKHFGGHNGRDSSD